MVMQSLPSLGLEALGVAVVCAAGSCAAVWLLWMLIRKRGAPDRKSTQEESGSWKDGAVKNGGGLRAVADSIVIVAFFAAGILCGLYGLLPFDVTEQFPQTQSGTCLAAVVYCHRDSGRFRSDGTAAPAPQCPGDYGSRLRICLLFAFQYHHNGV